MGREIRELSKDDQVRALDDAIHYWRSKGFPFPQMSPTERRREFELLCDSDRFNVIRHDQAHVNTIGLRLANYFHPQIWKIPCHGKSPVDRFNDDASLNAALSKAAQFYPNRRCWNAQCLRSVFRLQHRSRVANFRPTVARAIMQRYSGDGGKILDFSAGFGGRMLAAMSLRRAYIGIDPASLQIRGLRRMSKYVGPLSPGTQTIELGMAERYLPTIHRRSVELIFTSPPYFNRERYSTEPNQSYVRYPTYEGWLKGFLYPVIEESHRIIGPGGFFVINIANCGGNPIARDCLGRAKRLFVHVETIRLLMTTLPHYRANGLGNYRDEPIFVFRKR